jgi:hypothetical protein
VGVGIFVIDSCSQRSRAKSVLRSRGQMQVQAASLSTYCGAGPLQTEVEGSGSYVTEKSSTGDKGLGVCG